MSRYFLHLRDGDELIEDLEGSEFPDLEAARAEAIGAARDFVADQARSGRIMDQWQYEIWDAAGRMLAAVPLRAAVVLP